jgi:hypothetical protein
MPPNRRGAPIAESYVIPWNHLAGGDESGDLELQLNIDVLNTHVSLSQPEEVLPPKSTINWLDSS